MKRLLLACGVLVLGCTASQQGKMQQIEADVLKVDRALIVDSCKANPAAVSGVGIAKQFVPDPRAQAGLAAAQVGLSLQAKVCQSLGL